MYSPYSQRDRAFLAYQENKVTAVATVIAKEIRRIDPLRNYIPFSDYVDIARIIIKKAESAVIL